MGGEGSGRKPDPLKQFTPERAKEIIIKGASKPLELPNYSGVKKFSDERGGLFDGTHTESSTDSLTNKTIDDFTNHVEADEIHEELRNETGSTINRGDAVYISGFSVGQVRALVTLADSSSAATMPSVALLEDSSLANNATGHFVVSGTLEDVDTNSWTVGDEIYVSETGTTTNTLTNTKPTGAALIQKVAVVLRKHASNGVLEIFGAGRANEIPNVGGHEFSFGAHAAGFTQQTATGDGTTTIDWKLGNKFKFTFGAQNDTFTFTAPTNPCNLILVLIQDGTGSRIPTFPATVKWSGGSMPTFSTVSNSNDIVAMYYDGTNYFAVETLDFS